MKMSDDVEVEKTIELPPTESIQHSLGANHDLCSGIDELVDNAIDAKASSVCIVFHVDGYRLTRVAIHDDGAGMSAQKMERVLRLGGHEAGSASTIGIYGMGMKEGSYANADTVTVVSRSKGQFPAGIRMHKGSFTAEVFGEKALTSIWNLRNRLVDLKRGTTVLWDDLVGIYEGTNEEEGLSFLSATIERLRKHLGIRYHRFLEEERVKIRIFTLYDSGEPIANPRIDPINPCGYRKSGDPRYPVSLTVGGECGALGVTAHIWGNRSKTDAFDLEEKDTLGHQGLFVYVADRLITSGGWFGLFEKRKDYKLLRIVIDDPRVIDEYITVSPQKGSIRLNEGFHRFIASLQVCEAPGKSFEDVCLDAREVLRNSNKKSGKADPLAEGGQGLAPAIKQAIEDEAILKPRDPINVLWGKVPEGSFIEVDSSANVIRINRRYRKLFNAGKGSLNDAPLLKTLLFLLFNDIATSKKTSKAKSNTALWSKLLLVAADEELKQNELREEKF
ncbi:ATP-binding protein [Corynebacterium sp. UMB6689]|uniref:ATP-binding protein n=1 Tax=Corynebacterium TaxID=1716 RepID=UPI001C0F24FF|nr:MULTISPECIES: ATP-binding protein [Corynebacterium]MBU5654155.1 ATP-binding protein [Corynebacterium aurimucosum]MDK6814570.1 ATP-binding protein [Corynebacterium sp. UMB6689]